MMRKSAAARPLTQNDPAQAENRPAASRERILDAAVAEFATQGFAGARVDAIALRAGINKRMLYAYVGNKKALWLAALERVYEAKRQEERTLNLQRLAPQEAMQLLIRFNFRYHTDHPEFLAMLNDENLQRGMNLQESKRVAELYSPLLTLLSEVLARGQADGVFRQNVDPMQLYISVVGLGYFFCSNQFTLSAIFDRHLDSVEEVLTREQHIVDVLMGYLRP
ncbi:TetR/AcrR family transcriptional regulator [Telmatospirillum sp.]|uniref:TetR/AcrR family transcriptional regulator n=1 Tax=Telmatospirillum sp. TaxID=2079197 RepID=UPI00284C4064|nr:TetR/AcrR family transcriptional regulator [Telmatospirillum sp.]MDR3437492.1 TetR/AcrR family transcriptional regulator [Telmatospirillum sp.]